MTTPFSAEEPLEATHQAVESDRTARRDRHELTGIQSRYASLTLRERQVMAAVVSSRLNKEIAAQLGSAAGHQARTSVAPFAELASAGRHRRGRRGMDAVPGNGSSSVVFDALARAVIVPLVEGRCDGRSSNGARRACRISGARCKV